jgi:hypothetical protein
MKKGEYKGSAAERCGLQFCHTREMVAADQASIHDLGFALDSERCEMFESVAREQKADLQHKIFDALLDRGLEATERSLDSAKSLNPWNVNKAVDMFKDKGFKNEAVIGAVRRIAQQKDKPALAAAYHDFVDVAKSAKQAWDTGSEMARDPDNAELRLIVGALKVVQGNPDLGFIITTEEFSENLVYLGYISGQVSELTKVSDDKLARLAVLAKRLKNRVSVMNASKMAWQKATGYTTAVPLCGK